MGYVKNLQNSEKQKKNNVANNIVKITLLFIVLFVLLIIAFAFISIIYKSIYTVQESETESWAEILFGWQFDMAGFMGMGIIVINTIWMSLLVLLIAAPISIATAIFINKILSPKLRIVMIAVVSILAAIPSVVYGSFGKYFVLWLMYKIGLSQTATDCSLLSVVIIVSLMVMPTITLMSITSIMMTDSKMEDSSEALGATKIQTSVFVTLRAAKAGIIVGMLFALGRCIGEATAISMLNGDTIHQTGITLSPLKASLFMSPVIMDALSGSATKPGAEFAYEVLSGILLMTVIVLFIFVKWVESKNDDYKKSNKESKKANDKIKAIELSEAKQETTSKQKSIYKKHLINSIDYSYVQKTFDSQSIIYSRSSMDKGNEFSAYKYRQSLLFKIIITLLSLIGVIALISILAFLFDTNLGLLFNWEYLTSTGTLASNPEYWGLGMAMFGTMINIFLTLLIAMPLGIAIGVYSIVFINRESKMASVISFGFQIMTSIPAVIYGTLSTLLFASTGFLNNNYRSFIPILMLVLVILPTIIKQTQEGFKNVKSSQIEGSYALGSSTLNTSRRIVIAQSIPAILASAILATSIVMADSAILITILHKPSQWTYEADWLEHGGYTLATQIYWLSGSKSEISQTAIIEQIKVIGIILMILIFWLTIISQRIRTKNYWSSSVMFIGLLSYMMSFFIFGGVAIMMILGPILGIIGIFIGVKHGKQ